MEYILCLGGLIVGANIGILILALCRAAGDIQDEERNNS
jgi:hypothetical protein